MRRTIDALKKNEGLPSPALLATIAAPSSILELAEIAETRVMDKDIQAIHHGIAGMSDSSRQTATGPKAMQLLIRTKQVVGLSI